MSTPPPSDRTGPDDRDDPTRALDDFVRRLRPQAGPAAAPDPSDLSDLVGRLHPERASAAARPRGGTLRNGQTWSADEVEDVPVVEVRAPRAPAAPAEPPPLDLPAVDLAAEQARAAAAPTITLPPIDAPPAVDAQAVDDATHRVRDFAASQFDAPVDTDWQPSAQALRLRPATDPRLLARWQPGAWIGATRQVIDSSTAFEQGPGGPTVETFAPHRLLLLWAPPTPGQPQPGRWPLRVRLAALSRSEATAALLADVPGDAPLWLQPDEAAIDWALAAEAVLLHEPGLRPFQLDGLRAFIAAEREAGFAALNRGYLRDPVSGALLHQPG